MTLFGVPGATMAGFALTSALIEITPGPNMTWLAVVAVTEGRRLGLAAVAGVFSGLAVIGLAAAFGLATLIANNPDVYLVLKWGGVGYLVWLAWDGWRGAAAETVEPGLTGTTFFRRGLITNLLNPKAALFNIAVVPGFVDPTVGALPQTLVLTGIYVLVATGIHAGIVVAAGAARRLLEDPVRERQVRRALALVMLGVAVWFGWKA